MPYDLTGHVLLSEDVAALPTGGLAAYQALAELLLGVAGTDYTDETGAAITSALALQVDYMVARGVDAAAVVSQGIGARSITYRDSITSPEARAIVNAALGQIGSVWPRRPSLRRAV